MTVQDRPRNSSRTQRTARAACAVVASLAAGINVAGCSDDTAGGAPAANREAVTVDCPGNLGADDGGTQIEVQWQGPWDDVAAPALVTAWDEATDDVSVTVLPARPYGQTVSQLLSDDSPTLVRVPLDALSSLADTDAIRRIDECLADGLGTRDVVPGTGAIGLVRSVRYGIAGNVGVSVLAYDHAALTTAGLFDDGVPESWSQVADVATELRERGVFATPVVDVVDPRNVVGPELTTDVPPDVRAWDQLAEDDLLLTSGPQDDMLPVGGGAAAFEVADEGRLWAYGSALGQGQAP
jgi:hypothetical protein